MTFGLIIMTIALAIFVWQDILTWSHWLFGMLIYFLSILFFTPDLDTDSIVIHRWRHLSIIWWLFRKLNKHRGLIHTPILGTILKLCYLLLIFSPIWLLYLYTPNIPFSLQDHWKYCLVGIGVISIADMFHILLDYKYRSKKVND